MKVNQIFKYFPLLLMTLIIGCVEEISLTTETFEDFLVVEALITDEPNFQKIKLTRTYTLEEGRSIGESGAEVVIVADNGNAYDFLDAGNGTYRSKVPFGILPNVDYILEISTSDGEKYLSNTESTSSKAILNELAVRRALNDEGEEGLQITVDGQSASAGASNFLYQYEETYKIVSPYKADQNLVVDSVSIDTVLFDLVPKVKEESICYNTLKSDEILVTTTGNLHNRRVINFPIKFLKQTSPLIAHRYSILVRQYAISDELYQFYSVLKELSESENFFVQNQPGFIEGNIKVQGNSNRKVIGYFNVVTVEKKRIFFEYSDFFDNEDLKGNLVNDCQVQRPAVQDLFQFITNGRVLFLGIAPRAPNPLEGAGPYRVVPTNCMDCTTLGINVKPEFWEE